MRVYGWLERVRPEVMILTDGSGYRAPSRLARSFSLVEGVGARPTDVCGVLPDRVLYEALLRHDLRLLIELTDRMIAVIDRGRYDYVVGDAAEGAILGHDVFRAMLDAAIDVVRNERGRPLVNLDFALEAPPNQVRPELRERSYRIELDDAALDRKITACLAYTELVAEVQAALDCWGREAFAVECLQPAITETGLAPFDGLPAYEAHGLQAVADGRYGEAVRYGEHVEPMVEELRRHYSLLPEAAAIVA
jgi:hypothetical protein